MSITYIIATYSGKDHTRNGKYAETSLSINIQQLVLFLQNKRKKQLTSLIKQVLVVVPPVRYQDQFPNYYQFPKWREEFQSLGVCLNVVNYIGKNHHHSYDQWIQGMLDASFEYCMLIEDDYCIDVRNENADIDLLNMYKSKFPKNIGYLCSLVNERSHEYNAAISNGMISKTTINQFDDPLSDYYKMTSTNSQVMFSQLFKHKNIKIFDYKINFEAISWGSNQLDDFSWKQNMKHIMIPIQLLEFI